MSATSRPHLGTIHNVENLQHGLHPLNDPPNPATNAGTLFNRHFINRGGTMEYYRAFEIEAVFEGLAEDEEYDVFFGSSRLNPMGDDPVAEVDADTWRTTGAQHITRHANTIAFTIRGADLFTLRLTNPVNPGVGRAVSFYVTKYHRSDA